MNFEEPVLSPETNSVRRTYPEILTAIPVESVTVTYAPGTFPDKERIEALSQRVAALEAALRSLPLYVPEVNTQRYKDPLYGWVGAEYYPAVMVVPSETLIAARRVLESAPIGRSADLLIIDDV